jgi:hypothetical protein
VCNEEAPAGCTLSAVANVQSYGRLDGMLDDVGPPALNGRTMTWTITGTSNGNPSIVEVDVNGTTEVFRPGGPGRFSFQKTYTATEYNQNVTISVRLYDDDPGGRGEDRSVRTDRTGPPPPPTIGISRGASCNDGDEVLENNCWSGPASSDPPCDVPSCAFANLNITFASDAQKAIWRCEFDKFPFTRDEQGAGDFNGQVRAYYQSGETVAGTCRFSFNYADQRFVYTFP